MMPSHQIIEIFKSNDPIKKIALQFNISTSTVTSIKRGKYYKNITKSLGIPGWDKSSKKRPFLDDEIIKIYDFSGSISELKKEFNCGVTVARNIKFGNTYRDITELLNRDPGELKVYNLTWDDIYDIRLSTSKIDILASYYGVHKETIRNIQNKKTRKYC